MRLPRTLGSIRHVHPLQRGEYRLPALVLQAMTPRRHKHSGRIRIIRVQSLRPLPEVFRRVLRPGGEARIMVYHRSFWSYRVFSGLIAGIANGHLFRTKSFHETAQLITDGAIARLYTTDEWRSLVADLFEVRATRILGSKTGLVPLPSGRFKGLVMSAIPNRLSQFLNNQMRLGTLLFSTLRKDR